MRILCDQNVNEKYTETFRQTDWITVSTVREELAQDALDDEIGRYAAANNWVIFTEDDDHLEYEQNRGVILYHQNESASPTEVVAAVDAISTVYTNHREIREFVPGDWV